MKYTQLEKLKAYRVVEPSTDRTFESGDIIWVSKNGDINCINANGWISPDECDGDTLDFEAETADEYIVLKTDFEEMCMRMN